ncbi:MAG: GTP-binding protein [Planctomycetota bacterium]|jgi:GTP-binding protein
MFRDETEIEVLAGKGGDGLVSFRREKYVNQGGPDGGDGGKGGSVVLYTDASVTSLLALGRRYRYAAKGGVPGGPRLRTGAGGDDIRLAVPVGTQVFEAEHGNLLRDMDAEGMELVVARGGDGGKGNPRFANAVRQAPQHATSGHEGESRHIRLELKMFAQVGLLGFPNAGKSTFLSRVTAATPKIADYPFTTLVPHVGIADLGEHRGLLIADLPGLIEGAADGAGLGHRFLRHVERCRVLLHLVDVSAVTEREPATAWLALEEELLQASPELAAKPRLTVATKCGEDEGWEERVAELAAVAGEVLPISSVLGHGLKELLFRADACVQAATEEA